MSTELVCWKCGGSLADVPLPLSRYEHCRACGADLYCCRLCEFFDPRWRRGCREERAEELSDRERANFCDYFKPRPGAHQPKRSADDAARAQLEALFGGGAGAPAPEAPKSDAERAREELEKLFGKKP